MDFETSIDKAIDFSLDSAIKFLDVAQEFYPFSFLIDAEGKIISIKPNMDDYNFETSALVDDFKDFGNEKIADNHYSGFCVAYTIKLDLKGESVDAIAVFLKFREDYLPLKTRIYYFPYFFANGKPVINFDAAFSSEA